MSTSKNGFDGFERSLRESLDQFEVPYNSADWNHMERTLNGGNRGWWVSGVGLSVLMAGLVVVGGGAWYAVSGQRAVAMETSGGNTNPGRSVVVEDKSAGLEAMAETGKPTAQENTLTSGSVMDDSSAPVNGTAPAHDPDQRTGPEERTARANAEEQPTGTPEGTAKSAPVATAEASGITFKSSVAEGCPGTSVDFKVSNMPEDGIYLWNFGDGSFSNKANPEHTFTKPGSYQVMLSMSAAGVGTIQNKPSSDVIVIHESPMAAFNVLKQEYDGHLPSVHFENRSLAGEQYLWDFGDGQTSTIPHPDHIYKKKGVYQVELTVTNKIGCVDKIMKDVRIDKDYNLDAPSAFSPNGDDYQEAFMPEALRTLGVKFNLTVYSSNGTLLYQTNDATKPWTGRPQNRGELCGAGEYVWVVDVRESLHLAETYTGKVKLEL